MGIRTVMVTGDNPVTAAGIARIGFGVPGSQSANKKVDEETVGLTQTFFRDPKIGAMQLMLQYSNLKRTPFSVPAGTPSDAKLNMVYVNWPMSISFFVQPKRPA